MHHPRFRPSDHVAVL
nr:unnamed protein product [Callosobruchus analis]